METLSLLCPQSTPFTHIWMAAKRLIQRVHHSPKLRTGDREFVCVARGRRWPHLECSSGQQQQEAPRTWRINGSDGLSWIDLLRCRKIFNTPSKCLCEGSRNRKVATDIKRTGRRLLLSRCKLRLQWTLWLQGCSFEHYKKSMWLNIAFKSVRKIALMNYPVNYTQSGSTNWYSSVIHLVPRCQGCDQLNHAGWFLTQNTHRSF